MERTDARKSRCSETAQSLQGSARRLCMARPVTARGPGGQRRAARARGGGRLTMRQGTPALESGCTCLEAFAARGRKRVEPQLPPLLAALRALVDRHRHADPPCRTHPLSTRWSAAEGRRPLLTHQGDAEAPLPPGHTSTPKRNARGDDPQQVAHSQPPPKSPQPRRASTRGIGAIRPRRPQTTSYASPGMPQPR